MILFQEHLWTNYAFFRIIVFLLFLCLTMTLLSNPSTSNMVSSHCKMNTKTKLYLPWLIWRNVIYYLDDHGMRQKVLSSRGEINISFMTIAPDMLFFQGPKKLESMQPIPIIFSFNTTVDSNRFHEFLLLFGGFPTLKFSMLISISGFNF